MHKANSGSFKPKYAPIQIGECFGFWKVTGKGSYKHNQQRWVVVCQCGNTREVASQHLRSGKSTKCLKCLGRQHHEIAAERNKGLYGCNRRLDYIQQAVKKAFIEQNGICPICNNPLGDLTKAAWDHDHRTGEGRSLLHRGCNVFLGFIERDPAIINRVLAYCERYKIYDNAA